MNIKELLIILIFSSVCFSQNQVCLDALSSQVITKKFVLGKFDYKTHDLFVEVHPSHTSKIIYLNKEVYSAFLAMQDKAETDGINLKIISGTRNFNEQKWIWEKKWKKYSHLKPIDRAKKILKYSSMPASSRHHWGTDIDLNSLKNSYFKSGQGKTEYKWLLEHASSFGFYQVYTKKINSERTGYNLERWHWSYMPLASKYLSFYNKHIDYMDIMGFDGHEQAKALNIVKNYVNGISKTSKIASGL